MTEVGDLDDSYDYYDESRDPLKALMAKAQPLVKKSLLTAALAEVERLQGDLRHARLWGNHGRAHLPSFVPAQEAVRDQHWRYCWDYDRHEEQNVQASDGWQLGELVP